MRRRGPCRRSDADHAQRAVFAGLFGGARQAVAARFEDRVLRQHGVAVLAPVAVDGLEKCHSMPSFSASSSMSTSEANSLSGAPVATERRTPTVVRADRFAEAADVFDAVASADVLGTAQGQQVAESEYGPWSTIQSASMA